MRSVPRWPLSAFSVYDSPMPSSLALVIVTHNSATWLGPFVETWNRAVAHVSRPDILVVIADSGSQDDTLATAEKLLPTVQLLRLANVGYGSAANAAIRQTTAEWILLCNPDLTFPPTFLADLLAQLNAPAPPWPANAAIIGPRLLNPDGSHQLSVGWFPSFLRLLRQHFSPHTQCPYVLPPPQAAGAVEWLTGACLLIRRQPFDTVGGFDPGFFMFQEEVDLMRRLADVGYSAWYNPALTVVHHAPTAQQPPSADRLRWSANATQRYLAKHASYPTLLLRNLYWGITGRIPLGDMFARRGTLLARPTGPVPPTDPSGVPPCPHP